MSLKTAIALLETYRVWFSERAVVGRYTAAIEVGLMRAVEQNRWLVVFASMLGLVVVSGTINVFGFAVFVKPVCSALGISRSMLASGVLLMSFIGSVGTPCLGMLADRYGSRRILLVGIPLFALSISAFAFLDSSPLVIYGLFAMAGACGAMHNTVPYAKVISKWFDRERGLALGIAMAGIGLGIAMLPQLLKLLIASAGWRLAYAGLGAFIMFCAFVPVILFVREPSIEEMRHDTSPGGIARLPGVTFAQAIADWRFWAMGIGFFLAVLSTNGSLAHVIAMLTDRGFSIREATAALSLAGFGVIIGRLICGWCLDRFSGPAVSLVFFSIPALGIVMLAADVGAPGSYAGSMLCGAGLGAHVGMLAFFASRYFGLKAYGRIYGTLFGMFLMGTGAGPFVAGLTFDYLGSYFPALLAFAIVLLALPGVFLPMGPYPFARAKIKRPESLAGLTPHPPAEA